MTTVKDTLRNILNKVEQGNVTNEDIQTAQSILNSSIILLPRSELRKGKPHVRVRRRILAYQLPTSYNSQSKDFYTVQEVAERFQVSDKAIYKWIDQKKILYVRSNESSRDIRIPKAQFTNPPSKESVDRMEHELFKETAQAELVRVKDLYRDEE
ncbi:MAG: helix-turn-helix domain-containing protein [Paenibacillaceae bacterium]